VPDKPLSRWKIYIATLTPAKLLGTVEAPDADAGIAKAIQQFHIEAAPQGRLIAVRRVPE